MATDTLRGKSFAITGADTRPRVEMERVIQAAGGVVYDASKIRRYRPTYILVGYRPGNTKLDAGAATGATFIIEEDFWKMHENGSFVPRALTRDQAVIYATTLTNKGGQTAQTREYLQKMSGGASPIAAAPSRPAVRREEADEEFSIADFFEEDL